MRHQRILMPVHDLFFCFDFEFAQLFSEAADCLSEFLDIEFNRADLLAQARVVNTDFARGIEQIFE